MKKTLCIVLSALLVMMLVPSFITAETDKTKEAADTRLVNSGNVIIDQHGEDGYTGDYVVIYNPSTSPYDRFSTGDMTGRISTTVSGYDMAQRSLTVKDDPRPYVIDVDSQLPEVPEMRGASREEGTRTVSYNVGDTRYFSVYSGYCPLSNNYMEFKVLAKGEHCYIWTPTSTDSNVHPLDKINVYYAGMAAEEFDSKFDLMQSSFGDHYNGAEGDGRLNILYYNIDDGWQPGQGYTAGFFWGGDFYYNDLPCLNIDTYPGVEYVTSSGQTYYDLTSTYGTMVHEYQHLINYSVSYSVYGSYTDTWLNECMSAAAEEICYPGSSISSRVQSYLYYWFWGSEWQNPPKEHEYNTYLKLHQGYSLYMWSDELLYMEDLLALYAQVSFFAQYIYTQCGNTTFRAILERIAYEDDTFEEAFETVTGKDTSEFVRNFRVAMVANTSPDQFSGVFGFRMQDGYDPEQYNGVENLYNLLAPVVFTGSSANIMGGGSITVKPAGGVYYPPEDADPGLCYYGVTVNASYKLGDVNRDGDVTILDAVLTLRNAMNIIDFDSDQVLRGDVNFDKGISVLDAILILRYAMGIIYMF